jgi:hypothetical protein
MKMKKLLICVATVSAFGNVFAVSTRLCFANFSSCVIETSIDSKGCSVQEIVLNNKNEQQFVPIYEDDRQRRHDLPRQILSRDAAVWEFALTGRSKGWPSFIINTGEDEIYYQFEFLGTSISSTYHQDKKNIVISIFLLQSCITDRERDNFPNLIYKKLCLTEQVVFFEDRCSTMVPLLPRKYPNYLGLMSSLELENDEELPRRRRNRCLIA